MPILPGSIVPLVIPDEKELTPETVFYELRESREFGRMIIFFERDGHQGLDPADAPALKGLPSGLCKWVMITDTKCRTSGYFQTTLPAFLVHEMLQKAGFSRDEAEAARKPAWSPGPGENGKRGRAFTFDERIKTDRRGKKQQVVRVLVALLDENGQPPVDAVDRAVHALEETSWLYEGLADTGELRDDLEARGWTYTPDLRLWFRPRELAFGLRHDAGGNRFIYIDPKAEDSPWRKNLQDYHLQTRPDVLGPRVIGSTWTTPMDIPDAVLIAMLESEGYTHDPALDIASPVKKQA